MQVGLFAVFIAPESGESWKDSGTANLPSPSGFQMCICGGYAPNMEGFASLERPLLVYGSMCILWINVVWLTRYASHLWTVRNGASGFQIPHFVKSAGSYHVANSTWLTVEIGTYID